MKSQKLQKIPFLRTSYIIPIMIFALSFVLSGCGKDPELENYKANMNQFFENIKVFDESLNSIDPNSDSAVTDMLAILDTMDKSFAQMATLEVPEGFPGVDELASEASENMAQAASYYHQAFEGETYNASLSDVAKQYYDRANLRLQYILSILHGNIPEGIYSTEGGDAEKSGSDKGTDAGSEDTANAPSPDTGSEPGNSDGSAEGSLDDYSVDEYPDE